MPRPSRALFGAALLLGLLAVIALPGLAREPSREEELARIQRQIDELNKRLDELRKQQAAPGPPSGQSLPAEWVKSLRWRDVGPASMGGRIVALAVYEADPSTYWIATASGGLLKTTNNGVTFAHQFDREATVAIGDVAVAQSDRNVVWVGTGENNPRNSVSYGDGVYKSLDGGKTWKNVGLKKSFQIGRIAIHPKNPDVVYVGALGRLYGPNEERGLYKTEDGGKTWKRALYVDNNTGVIDVQMHPTDPATLLVATWERARDGYDSHAGALATRAGGTVDPPMPDGYDAYDPVRKWGAGSGIWKTTDGGKTWKRITAGLPTAPMGRIGLDYYRKDPRIVFAIVDSQKIGMGSVPTYLGVQTEKAPGGARLTAITPDSPAEKAKLKAGDVVTTIDKKALASDAQLGEMVRARKPGDKIALTVLRAKETMTIEATLEARPTAPRRTGLDFKSSEVGNGVRVEALAPRGPSMRAGLKVGDVIQQIDKKPVKTTKEVSDTLRSRKPGGKAMLEVLRGKEAVELTWVAVGSTGSTTRPYAFFYGGQRENVQDTQGTDGFQYGGVYKSVDGGESWQRINSVNPRPMYFSQVRVDPSDEKLLYVLGIRMHVSRDGGKTFRPGGDRAVHPDQHALWINPRDGRHLLVGTDGGTYASYDRGDHWDFLDNSAIGQFYHVCVDNRKPYRVYGGMQDNGSWGGPSRGLDGRGPINADWSMVHGGDGFVCRVDPVDSDVVYCESQEGNMVRRHLRTGERASIKPVAPAGGPPYRFNWNTPFVVSHHNPRIVYCAGNRVFRSLKRGSEPKPISPELTRGGKASASALAESPKNADVLWVGTDDGNLWVTRDGGANWANVAAKVGLRKPFWVSTIEASHHKEGRAYVAFDAHRSDDDDPYVYVTEDFGQTWKSLRGNLPAGSSRVLREDQKNEEVLYLGTEFAAWASVDRGGSWTRINNNLPTVAIHELAQATTAPEVVAATHGRSLWILDVSALRQMKASTHKADATLFEPAPAIRWRTQPYRGTVYGAGSRGYAGQNPPSGAQIYYALGKKAGKLKLEVKNYAGQTVAVLQGPSEAGLHRVTWNLLGGNAPMPAGQYRVVLTVDGKEQGQGLRIERDPNVPDGPLTAEEAPRRKRPSGPLDH